ARAAGILTAIDGAHAPGQIDLDLEAIGADFYCANCHKWLCSPKGAGFIYARPEAQDLLAPLIISWGYKAYRPGPSLFLDHFERLGTGDPSAYLSVPAAIEFQREHDWPAVRASCHALANGASERIGKLTDLPQLSPNTTDWWSQMRTVPLPPVDGGKLHDRLWDEYRIEIPVAGAFGRPGVRISVQAYNTQEDLDRLVEAVTVLLPEVLEEPA
ncbi:MAG TPA: aminotransferase class V-fold PLP-dependent enzyme, partial [Chloroflexota bacterium]|nr:aminotransferase class V-fold PLP-dependent enzyme [Chloroflexota bacterium]